MAHKKLFLLVFVLTIHNNAGAAWCDHECMAREEKIYVAGHQGLVGSAIVRALQSRGYMNIVTRSKKDLDLRDPYAVAQFFEKEKPAYVFLAAARVGGIKANSDQPADFVYDNIVISANVVHAAYVYSVKKLIFLGSSCIYPRACPQPIKEEYLLTGPLERTNLPYAVAKIAGITLCQAYNHQYGTNFISCMPTNLYGPHDNFDLATSHVIPALIAKMHEAKLKNLPTVTVWGTGTACREFLYVDDLASAVIFLMNHYNSGEIINVGVGADMTIAEVAALIKKIVNYPGKLVYDSSFPDGTEKKLLDVTALHSHGWKAQTTLDEGLKKTYQWYILNRSTLEDRQQ